VKYGYFSRDLLDSDARTNIVIEATFCPSFTTLLLRQTLSFPIEYGIFLHL
jgi:hypothetical protein